MLTLCPAIAVAESCSNHLQGVLRRIYFTFFAPPGTKFGTWDGVYFTCMSNIIGVILFLRMGYIVGNMGMLTPDGRYASMASTEVDERLHVRRINTAHYAFVNSGQHVLSLVPPGVRRCMADPGDDWDSVCYEHGDHSLHGGHLRDVQA
jgi:hypothetical protein